MNLNQSRPTAKELAELSAYLAARDRSSQPGPGETGYPMGFIGELLKLAEQSEPDPTFADHLELQLREAARVGSRTRPPGWLPALWLSLIHQERKIPMKRLAAYAFIGIILFVIVWVTLPSLLPSSTQTQMAVATSPTSTPVATPLSPLTPTPIPPTSQPPVAINFTPQPIPSQPPILPALADALGTGYGGMGTGNLPQGLPISLATELPESPAEVSAYYRLESNPLSLEEAREISTQWKLSAEIFIPPWMQSISPDQPERSYHAIDGMQDLGMWNRELSFTNLLFSPVFDGHQYPPTGLPPADQAVVVATQFLIERGYLDYAYQVDLNQYDYGLVNFYRLMDDLPIDYLSASVKITPGGQVGSAWVSREEYQSIGSYPVIHAQAAWELLVSGQPSDQRSVSYYPIQDGNPQFWGRSYANGQSAQLFGAPRLLLPAEEGESAYIQLNNLVLAGDLSGLQDYLQSNPGYIHAWGEVQEVNGTRQLLLEGWEPFDEFSGYFDGIVRRSAEGNFLELSDGIKLGLPDLPADVPADIPLYAQGGRVESALEWFILQVHPADEGQVPPDLTQVQAVVDKVELVYLAPGLNNFPADMALDPVHRMLIPAWKFTGAITNAGGADLAFQAYVQAVTSP